MSTTPGERRALLFLGAIAALGGGMRLVGDGATDAVTPSSIEALQKQIEASESAGAESRRARQSSRKKVGSKGSHLRDTAATSYERGGIRPLTDAELRGRPLPAATLPRTTRSAAPSSALGGAPVNVNSATLAELQSLPGIGPALAERIIRHRTEAGPFVTIEDLDRVRGIGPAMLQRIGPLVTF